MFSIIIYLIKGLPGPLLIKSTSNSQQILLGEFTLKNLI